MDSINQFLIDMFGPLGPLYAVGGLGLVLVVATLPMFLKKQVDPLDKLSREKHEEAAKSDKQGLRSKKNAPDKMQKLEKYKSFLEPNDEEEYSAIQLKLLQAGYPGKNAVRSFHFAQFALGLGMLVLGVGYAVLNSATGETTTQSLILSVLIPGAVGYMAPKYWVTRRAETRKEEITNGFPDALDMMLVCVEAGQSLDQSIMRVGKELRAGFPSLADEFEIVAWELKAGKDRIQVLRDMGERAGVPDVASFVTVLIQSATFGTSIAEALRVYAGEMRDKRVMRAEEKANTLPTKMTLATMMLTVPPLLIILIGPSVYAVGETLSSISF
ncbi:type II secretion system F family protein [Maritimibacter fusiformis]|jgi:tight adherence protein C|uniref:Type II secretion system F family protein n=1 Tax=Maritimibacter fusiformis TaxID=2603819 RepID=A0A5D0RPQ2_9RHOB|nr:type II secretion system F family protein [Maritimibacter fusiformis]TYB82976.1 type II secretion system F family protein [Maritimibacter fusiformis]